MLAIPADGFTDDPRPVNGDALLNGTLITLYNKANWPLLAQGLTEASQGDATIMRFLADAAWGNNFDGTFDPGTDRYFTIGAIEQKYPRDIDHFLEAGDNSWGMFEHFWLNSGYVEIPYALWPIHDKDAYSGPFTASKSAPTVLEVATTYDPATPFRGAKRLATQLGNVRFLTMVGDGHTAYLNGSPTCIDSAIVAYIGTLALPDKGTVCTQDLPFVQPAGGVGDECDAGRDRLELRGAAAVHRPARVPLGDPVRAGCPSPGTQRVRLRPEARRLGHAARPGARGARVTGARVAPGGLVPGRVDLGVEGEAALRHPVGGDEPERAWLDGREVAAPVVAGEVDARAPEAERMRAARAEDDALVRRPVVGGLLPPGGGAVEAAVRRGPRAAQRAVRREGDQQAFPVVAVVAAQRGQRQVARLRVRVVRPELARPGPWPRARRARAARAPRCPSGRRPRDGSASTRAPRRRRR